MCDQPGCPSAYHPCCLGLVPGQQEAMDKFICPWCDEAINWAKKGGWAQQPASDVETAVRWICTHDFANHFSSPAIVVMKRGGVGKRTAEWIESYKAQIKEPMDLGACVPLLRSA